MRLRWLVLNSLVKHEDYMINEVIRKLRVIDADGYSLGRLASEVARLLQGKNKTSYAANRDGGDRILLKNINKAQISGKKLKQKAYFHYSGYPGGIRKHTLEELWTKNPQDVFLRVVKQMLPDNTLRRQWMKRIKFYGQADKK